MDLRGQLPTHSFQYLVNTDNGYLFDGTGSLITFLTIENISSSIPTYPDQVATKQYVDNLNFFGLDFYFRTASVDGNGTSSMLRLDVQLSASTSDIVVLGATAGQYVYQFISPALGITNLAQGSIDVHYHVYRTGGNAANTIFPELYISQSTGITELIGDSSPILITTIVGDQLDSTLVLTSSVVTDVSDRLIVKFKIGNGAGTPDVHFLVEGNTAAGLTVPTPSSNFVFRAGDTMTGPLTASVYGTSSWSNNSQTSSYITASNIVGGITTTLYASSASTYITMSFINGILVYSSP